MSELVQPSAPLDLPVVSEEPPSRAAPCPDSTSPSPASLDSETLRSLEPALRSFAYRAVSDEELMHELVQETLTAALENRARFEGRSKLRTWLTGILARKIADHYRKAQREVLTDTPPEPDITVRAGLGGVPPERRIDGKRALGVIERTLDTLPRLERMAVLSCDIEQMDRQEAQQSLGVTGVYLRVLLHRGRHRLRKALEDAEMGY